MSSIHRKTLHGLFWVRERVDGCYGGVQRNRKELGSYFRVRLGRIAQSGSFGHVYPWSSRKDRSGRCRATWFKG